MLFLRRNFQKVRVPDQCQIKHSYACFPGLCILPIQHTQQWKQRCWERVAASENVCVWRWPVIFLSAIYQFKAIFWPLLDYFHRSLHTIGILQNTIRWLKLIFDLCIQTRIVSASQNLGSLCNTSSSQTEQYEWSNMWHRKAVVIVWRRNYY